MRQDGQKPARGGQHIRTAHQVDDVLHLPHVRWIHIYNVCVTYIYISHIYNISYNTHSIYIYHVMYNIHIPGPSVGKKVCPGHLLGGITPSADKKRPQITPPFQELRLQSLEVKKFSPFEVAGIYITCSILSTLYHLHYISNKQMTPRTCTGCAAKSAAASGAQRSSFRRLSSRKSSSALRPCTRALKARSGWGRKRSCKARME